MLNKTTSCHGIAWDWGFIMAEQNGPLVKSILQSPMPILYPEPEPHHWAFVWPSRKSIMQMSAKDSWSIRCRWSWLANLDDIPMRGDGSLAFTSIPANSMSEPVLMNYFIPTTHLTTAGIFTIKQISFPDRIQILPQAFRPWASAFLAKMIPIRFIIIIN